MQPEHIVVSEEAPDRRPFFSHGSDLQRHSSLVTLVGKLFPLGAFETWHDQPPPRRRPREIPVDDYSQLASEAAAIRYCVNHSGLAEKVIAYETRTDAGTFSKAKAGQARLNEDALHALMDLTGIEAPLFGMLLRRGYDPRSLRRIEADVERENRELRERLHEIQHEREIERRTVRELMRGHS